MPAIDLVRLRFQIADLLDVFSEPEEFKRRLHLMFDSYSRRSLRQSKLSTSPTFIPTFNCHPQLIRQIGSGLRPGVIGSPQEALTIADYLWADEYLESQKIAALLLGMLPVELSEEVIARIIKWAHPQVDRVSLDFLLMEVINILQKAQLKKVESLIYSFLNFQDKDFQRVGLKLMEHLVHEPAFTGVPSLFKLISPLIIEPGSQKTQIDVSAVIEALARRTPIETSFFLQQLLHLTPGREIEKTISRYISFLPEENQASLLLAIRNHSK